MDKTFKITIWETHFWLGEIPIYAVQCVDRYTTSMFVILFRVFFPVFSQNLLWLKMHNWCKMKVQFSSFNSISHTYLHNFYFPKYIHIKDSRWSWWWLGRISWIWLSIIWWLICACAAVSLTEVQNTSFKFVINFLSFTAFSGKTRGFLADMLISTHNKGISYI